MTIAFGTDAGSPVVGHDVVGPELKHMVKVGVVPDNYAALRTATSVAAQINKLDAKLGILAAGKLADVIVVDGDPVDDLIGPRQRQDDVCRWATSGLNMREPEAHMPLPFPGSCRLVSV